MSKKAEILTVGSIPSSSTTLNTNFSRLNDALDNTLSRDGSTPNQMLADIDLNNNDILNVNSITTQSITIAGIQDSGASAAAALASANAAAVSEANAATSETNAATSASEAAASALEAQATALGALQADQNLSDVDSAPTALVNLGLTATTAELNYVDGVTSAIQTQLDAKQATVATQLQAVWDAGTDTTESTITAAKLAGAIAVLALTPATSFVSADQTITSAGLLTLAHGLGQAPNWMGLYLKCVTAQHGYIAGDEIYFGMGSSPAKTNGEHASVYTQSADADTNIYVRYGNSSGVFSVVHKTTGSAANGITLANWRVVIKAGL